MRFKKNERVRVVPRRGTKSQAGVHLKSIRYQGKTLHIVMLDGHDAPVIMDVGQIERASPSCCCDEPCNNKKGC